jgi:hypothetical protein
MLVNVTPVTNQEDEGDVPRICQPLRKTISGEFYFGAMCRETRRRIAISTDTNQGSVRYSQSGETIVFCHHCRNTHRFDNRDIFSFQQIGWE